MRLCRKDSLRCEEKQWKGSLISEECAERTARDVRLCRKDSLRCEEKQWKGSLMSEECAEKTN